MLLPWPKKWRQPRASQTKARACSRDHGPAPRARSRLHRDSDLMTGSVDHTHCCMAHAACDSPVIGMDAEHLNLLKNDRSGNSNGLELSERREKHHFFPSKRNKEQTRHVLIGTINFHLMLVATQNLVELVRSCRRLGVVIDTPVKGPISFNGGRERRFLWNKKWMCAFC